LKYGTFCGGDVLGGGCFVSWTFCGVVCFVVGGGSFVDDTFCSGTICGRTFCRRYSMFCKVGRFMRERFVVAPRKLIT
jgi:hypothetical protein